MSKKVIIMCAHFLLYVNELVTLFKRSLYFLMNSMIGLGQALLKLDGIGVDELVIGFVVNGLIQIRASMEK